MYYRDLARDGTPRWAFDGQGQEIGSGWFVVAPSGAVDSYCTPLSATVQYETKRNGEHRHGPHSIRIDANRPGVYRSITNGLSCADAGTGCAGLPRPSPRPPVVDNWRGLL